MKKILSLIAVAALAIACDHEPDNKVKHGDQLVFKTEDKVLQNGDLVGVSMDSPLSYINVKMTYDSGSLKPGSTLYWPAVMPADSAVTFMAYYPYTAEYNDGGYVVFSAEPDQTTDAAFKASALMVAVAKAATSDPAVEFTFAQKMSKFVFYLRNDSGSPVKDVCLNAYPTVQFNMDKADVRVTGEKVDIHAHLTETTAEGVQAYEAIIAPQKTALTLSIKTDAGEYTALMSTKTQFAAEKQYSNARLIVLSTDNAGRNINFAVNEADWTPKPTFEYLDPIAEGAELTEITDPGLYKMTNGAATPMFTYSPGENQYSMLEGRELAGWRLMSPAEGKMFELSSKMVYSVEGHSSTVSVRSFGIEEFEPDYTSTATTVKFGDGLAWMLDDNKEYGYIILSE